MMIIIEFLRKKLEGRGFLASFLVISGWSYVIILIIVLIFQVILLIINKTEGEE
jgi:hypothetical protein